MQLAQLLLNPLGKINRTQFLVTGLLLTALKLALDYIVTTVGFHQIWNPIEYIWSKSPLMVFSERNAHTYFFTMLLIAVPFAWIGVCLCCKRLRSANAPIWLVLFFFVPIAKWFLFANLVALPEKIRAPRPLPPLPPGSFRAWIGATAIRSAAFAVIATAAIGTLFAVFSIHVLRRYGSTLFVGVPFYLGIFSTLIHEAARRRTLQESMVASLLSLMLVGALLLTFAIEGVICLAMAAPIAIVENILGALIGHALVSQRWRENIHLGAFTALVFPILFASESQNPVVIRSVTTEIVVSANCESVWHEVIAFSEIPPPRELIFRAGIAYPIRAHLDGSGVGTTRHCIFSTGEFVEPITIWKEPTQLGFAVSAQPDAMTELSPYGKIDTPHLHGYFESQRGEFRLAPMPDGRTRLMGTTWYINRLTPAKYWNLWSDYIIHSIHRRVLEHIKNEAERNRTAL